MILPALYEVETQPNRTIEIILEEIRNAPPGEPVVLGWADRIILDPLFADGWPDVGYYAGHHITFTGAETQPGRQLKKMLPR